LQNEPEHITHDHPTNDFFSTMPPSSNTLTRSGLVQQASSSNGGKRPSLEKVTDTL
jgi:hypothetical protein